MACVNASNTFTFYARIPHSSLTPSLPKHNPHCQLFVRPSQRVTLSTVISSVSVTAMSRVLLNLRKSTAAIKPKATPGATSGTTATDDSTTTLFFTSRIAMPSTLSGYSTNDHIEIARGNDDYFYGRDERGVSFERYNGILGERYTNHERMKEPLEPGSAISEPDIIELDDMSSPTSLIPHRRPSGMV